MTGLLPGVVVGGRYTLVRLLSEQGDAQAWAVRDDRLDRSATLVVLPDQSPLAAGVYDAAQRAAGVDNHRLVRILDIAEVDGWVYFVEESLEGARSLTELAGAFGLAAEEVRRITGEAALGLDAARRRGLHHLGLTPDNVLRMPDGSVKVAGLATQAALVGQDHIGGKRALRRDAKGLVALAYAGLTGRWPYAGDVGLQPAPRVVGGVPRPSELAVGVPSDLDVICQQTLNQNLGPVSPADYAAQIAPWSAMTVADREVLAATPDAAEQAREADVAAADPGALDGTPLGDDGVHVATLAGAQAAMDTDSTAPIPVGVDATTVPRNRKTQTPPADDPSLAAPGGTQETTPIPTSWLTPAASAATGAATAPEATDSPEDPASPGPARPAGGAAGIGAATTAALGGLAANARKLTTRLGRGGTVASGVAASGVAATSSAATGVAVSGVAASGAAAAAGPTVAGVGGEAPSSPAATGSPGAGTVSSPDSPAVADVELRGRRARPTAADVATREVSIASIPAEPHYEAPAPLLPAEAGAPPSRAQSRFVLVIFAALTALAGIVGAAGASQIGKGIDLNAILGPDSTHVSTPKPTASSSSQAPSGSGEPLAIIGATGYDPEGGGDENNDLAARVYDEDPNTYWQSEGYQGPKFGGLKSGVGLVVDLGQQVTPSAVTLTLPNPSNLDLYLANEPDKTGAQLLGTVNGKSGQVVVKSTSGASGRYIIVWFTDAPLVADGRYRAMLSEITVSG